MILGRPYDQDAMLTGDQPMGQLTVPPRRSLSGAIEDALAGGLGGLGASNYNARQLARGFTGVAGMIPPVGTAMALDEVKKALEERSPVGAATAAIGLVPGAKGAARYAEKEAGAAAQAAVADPKLRAKAEALFGKYPQYAENYPAIGPPSLMEKGAGPKGKDLEVPLTSMADAQAKVDAGTHYFSKQLTPEAEQFQKDRAIIQKDMDVNGYEPHYDPAKRFDVVGNYGPFTDTAAANMPAKQATIDKWAGIYGSPESRARLQQGFERGQQMTDTDRWYLMGQLENDYIKHLGPEEGTRRFKSEFADMMAATTGGSSPRENQLMSHYASFMNQQGQRLPTTSYELPFPIGGRYAPGNIANAQRYIDEGMQGFDVTKNPKRYDFSSAFLGNRNAATTDEQMMGALQPGIQKPEWYGPATDVIRQEAAAAGVTPREFQDVTWGGLKSLKDEARGVKTDSGFPMINEINETIERTHRLTGIPKDEVVRRGLVLKEMPMYGAAGTVGLGAAMQGSDQGEAWQPPEQAQQQVEQQPAIDPRQAIAYSLMQQPQEQ